MSPLDTGVSDDDDFPPLDKAIELEMLHRVARSSL